MSLRCARSAGPAVLALVALLAALSALFGGAAAPPAAAAAANGRALSLIDQTPWVVPTQPGSTATFSLEISARQGTPGTDEVVATLYDRLPTRSGFERTLSHIPTGKLDHTHPVRLATLTPATGGGTLEISILPDVTATPAPGAATVPAGTPTLDLTCVPGTGTCTGVYPLVVTLEQPSGTTVGRFTTYLTYSLAKSQTPLDFAWVVPVDSPVTIRTGERDPTKAVAPPSRSTTDSLAGLAATLAAKPGVAVTVAASPQTLQSMDQRGGAGRRAVRELATMSSADRQTRQFLAQSYVPIDLGALAGAGEGEEVKAQMGKGAAVLKSLGVQVPKTTGTWVATGKVGSALRTGMSQVGATQLVLPDADLATPRGTGSTLVSVVTLPLGRGAPVTAAASDGELAVHFTADPRDPALGANQLLADLAMIHFEEPNTPSPRAVVAVPPSGWTPTTAFDSALLAGLTGDPVVQAVTLDSYFSAFSSVPSATKPARRLASGGTGPVLAPSLARNITRARLRLTGFDSAVPAKPSPPVLNQLDQLLLAAECDGLQGSGQAAGVATFEQALGGQLSQVKLATERTITLTARTGYIPITIDSTAPYTVTGTLTLTGGRFVFPHGDSTELTLDHSTNPVRMEVEARTSGDLPLEATFRSPRGALVIASGQLTVRSTATSLVGVVLTVLALVVLLGWWARTWRAGRRRRATRPGGASGA